MTVRTSRALRIRRVCTQIGVASITWLFFPKLMASGTVTTLSEDVQPIFDSYCVVCHLYGGASADLVLEDGDSFSQLVNRKSTQSPLQLVAPFKPDSSYLVLKLRGQQAQVEGSGGPMPSNGTALNTDQLDTVIDWINSGALE